MTLVYNMFWVIWNMELNGREKKKYVKGGWGGGGG